MTVKEDLDSDLGEMLSPNDFGEVALFKPVIGSSFSVNVIFNKDQTAIQNEDGITITQSHDYNLVIRLSDFSVLPKPEDEVEVAGGNYSVWNIEKSPDGIGIVWIKAA